MTKEVVLKVGDFVTPVETGNTIGVIHRLDNDTKLAKMQGPIKVLYLDLEGHPIGSWGNYRDDQLIKTPRKYRLHLKTSKLIIKEFEAI